MNKQQARRIALAYLASIAEQDDGRLVDAENTGREFSEADRTRLSDALESLSDELYIKAGFTRNAYTDTGQIVNEVLGEPDP